MILNKVSLIILILQFISILAYCQQKDICNDSTIEVKITKDPNEPNHFRDVVHYYIGGNEVMPRELQKLLAIYKSSNKELRLFKRYNKLATYLAGFDAIMLIPGTVALLSTDPKVFNNCTPNQKALIYGCIGYCIVGFVVDMKLTSLSLQHFERAIKLYNIEYKSRHPNSK